MRKIFFYSLLFLPIFSFSQNKFTDDVIFVLYEDSKNPLTKVKWQESKNNTEKDYFHYCFYFNKVDNLCLSFSEFENFDEKKKDNPMLFFKINKRFLKTNKDIILTKKDMLKLGYEDSNKLFYNAKHILLIDKNETKNGKITIKKVRYISKSTRDIEPVKIIENKN